MTNWAALASTSKSIWEIWSPIIECKYKSSTLFSVANLPMWIRSRVSCLLCFSFLSLFLPRFLLFIDEDGFGITVKWFHLWSRGRWFKRWKQLRASTLPESTNARCCMLRVILFFASSVNARFMYNHPTICECLCQMLRAVSLLEIKSCSLLLYNPCGFLICRCFLLWAMWWWGKIWTNIMIDFDEEFFLKNNLIIIFF